ncbi:CDP-glycerol glycerophosphotransferase family protein [Galactobacter caseinivorans]|uniref:CDP-glycerol--glycerophosphate glycerophosphotransferase n=1 Tax=Galactobacter caseinivorans TaxID=2676123 RepID=A0A496PGT1_9MICC|nr:CDP-glycerol glycerophosphotransferase family protein [Galactobacter caseinivorans]RKW69690.1 CDP-glycerol--glycerophosphate glycerophosphotransferase [Galactobacter caseinivorans]
MQVREVVNSALKSEAWKRTSQWIRGTTGRGPAAGHELDGVKVPAQVVVYFGDDAEKIYQIQQWIPVLERLNQTRPVVLVFRKLSALRATKSMTALPKIFVRRFEDLMSLYGENEYKLALYVNNGVNNFQSINEAHAVHVHVNHGESDKISMVANQVKAYDRVFVAGPAAVARHERVLFDFDMNHLETVGRPQLDIEFPAELDPVPGLRTVMYAPTWSGENEANNYTSLDLYGRAIVKTLLGADDVRVVYKPHPRVADADDAAVRAAHEWIVAQLKSDKANTGRAHEVRMEGNILAMFDAVEAMITDVSSVGLDFLYTHPEKPLVLTDRRSDPEALAEEAPVSRGCAVVDATSVQDVKSLLRGAIRQDQFQEERARIRTFYFGDVQRGDSTALFTGAIERLIEERGAQVIDRRARFGESASVVGE